MTDTPVPFLRYDSVVVNKDGTLVDWFVNAFNTMVERTGGQTFNGLLGVINGQTELQDQLEAVNAARIAGDAALQTAGSGGGGSTTNSTVFSGGVSSGATWVQLAVVTITPGGAGGDYAITLTFDATINGALSGNPLLPAEFLGEWRLVEEETGGGTEYILDSDDVQVEYTPRSDAGDGGAGTVKRYDVSFVAPASSYAANNSAQSDIRLEFRRKNGTNEITAPGLSGALSVTWTA